MNFPDYASWRGSKLEKCEFNDDGIVYKDDYWLENVMAVMSQ